MLRLMLRRVLPAALMLAALLIAAVRLIPVRGDTAPDIRAILAPPDACAAPCWQGIQPGETSIDEAVALLAAHPWVAAIAPLPPGVAGTAHQYRLVWSGAQPAYIDGGRPGHIYGSDQGIEGVILWTTLRFGDLWMQLGPPDHGDITLNDWQLVEYSALPISGLIELHCARFWEQRVRLEIRAHEPNRAAYDYSPRAARDLACAR
ncbi:MAG: hypothetical protein GYB67_02650 [Chloroflexi bacterium]|nr:hypothetical protein [Chloroflexota bacterium]